MFKDIFFVFLFTFYFNMKKNCNTLLEPNEISVNFYISPKYSFILGGARLNFTSLYVIYRNFTL